MDDHIQGLIVVSHVMVLLLVGLPWAPPFFDHHRKALAAFTGVVSATYFSYYWKQ